MIRFFREQELEAEVGRLKEELKRLHDMFLMLKREKFGSKSERVEELSEQLIFNEIEVESKDAPPEPKTVEVKSHKKGRRKKKLIPEGVPREETIVDLPEEKKVCPHDGTPLKEIGFETSEKLKSFPARHVVSIIKTKKYACPF